MFIFLKFLFSSISRSSFRNWLLGTLLMFILPLSGVLLKSWSSRRSFKIVVDFLRQISSGFFRDTTSLKVILGINNLKFVRENGLVSDNNRRLFYFRLSDFWKGTVYLVMRKVFLIVKLYWSNKLFFFNWFFLLFLKFFQLPLMFLI